MPQKTFWFKFGSGDPRTNTGLTPTFLVFQNSIGATLATPGITQPVAGTGFYTFGYSIGSSYSLAFLIDGATTALSNTDRYVSGALDPVQTVDVGIGYIPDSFGASAVDPTTLFGYLKRMQELTEGDQSFTKATGTWLLYNRGSSTLLRTKTLNNAASSVTKTGV
jgi:hypothetical protein